MTAAPAPDQAHRDRIATDLDRTLFVEAGAGSGKTTALVDRVVRLVESGEELRSIAAITFTEKAGAELRDRLREALESRIDAAGPPPDAGDPDPVARHRLALEQLDGAAIGTLHSFAQRVLAENPVEAGLPPRVEVLDELSSEVEFERRWTAFRDDLLDDAEMERALLLFFATGVDPSALRALAVSFDLNWDLVEERVPPDPVDPPPVGQLLEPALAQLEELCRWRAECTDPDDALCVALDNIATLGVDLRAVDDELEVLEVLARALGLRSGTKAEPSFRLGGKGRAPNWPSEAKDTIKQEALAVDAALRGVFDRLGTACIQPIAARLRTFTLAAARERRTSGRVSFHDLLVLSRALVRHPDHGPVVRERLHHRYRRLLLDEFQDTDPIQIELAVRIAAADPAAAEAGTLDWEDVDVTPGQLFVVGDPKQSIYRFRRADIAVFLQARDRYGILADGLVELAANFRTVEPLIDWVNQTFTPLMAEAPEVDLPVPSQPAYRPLLAVRGTPPAGPAVSVLGREPVADKDAARAEAMRTAEAEEVAATVVRALEPGREWAVSERGNDRVERWRPARAGDITILLPARTSLPFLEAALEERDIPYRTESSSLVYGSRAVRDLLMTLRAADDPTDHLAVVSALRSSLFACGDDDLFRFKVEQRGHWNYLAPQPDTVSAGVVAEALAYLREIHLARHWQSPAELLSRIARDRRSFEMGFGERRARDVWRRLRFVIDQARSWGESTVGGTRDYLAWVARQTVEGARVAEAVLPETDDDAVRIMTIHAAKGLEFPITIVSGMSTAPQRRTAPADVAFPPVGVGEPRLGRVAYKFGRHVTTEEWSEFAPIDEQMGHDERIRLLYVATTRAKDHLVVSLRRAVRATEPEGLTKLTNAELLVRGMGDRLGDLPDAVDGEPVAHRPAPPAAPPSPEPYAPWRATLDAALAAAARPTTVAATALTDESTPDVDAPTAAGAPDAAEAPVDAADRREDALEPGLQKRGRDLDLPPWLKGRYGTAVGRAVHGVLQTVDLATGEGLDAAVAAQCQAEALVDRVEDVTALARHALASPTIREAATRPHWREIYTCTPVADGRLLEGYVDLLYRAPEGLVVVDHKTAATTDAGELDRRVDGYRLQGASYALAIARTTGEVVTRVVFVFLTPAGAVERDLPDLDGAVAEVERLVADGRETLVAEGPS